MVEKNWGKELWPWLSEVHEPQHGGERDCTPGAKLLDLPPSSPRRSCRRDLPPPKPLPAPAAVHLPEYTRQSSRKALAADQLPEYTAGAAGGGRMASMAAGLPPKLRRQSGGGGLVAVRQLSSGSTIPFSFVSPPKLRRQSGRERDCIPGAELQGYRRVPHRRSCSSAGPQILSYDLIGGEWGSGR
jgi:hypothetical protein